MPNQENQEKILTLNLNGKKGVNISKHKYDAVKNSIISNLKKHKSVTMTELSEMIKQELGQSFDGKIGWYFMAVKLDLEARGQIQRLENVTPQALQIKGE